MDLVALDLEVMGEKVLEGILMEIYGSKGRQLKGHWALLEAFRGWWAVRAVRSIWQRCSCEMDERVWTTGKLSLDMGMGNKAGVLGGYQYGWFEF